MTGQRAHGPGFELPLDYDLLEDSGYAYTQIYSFSDNEVLSVQLWERLMRSLQDEGVPGLIIDMRINGGGIYTELVDLLSRAGEDDPPVRVSFSRIHGEHATFLMADDGVDRFGEHADRYDNLNFFGEAKDSQKD